MSIGIEELRKQLEELGYKVLIINNRFVSFDFRVQHGRFKGRDIQIALEAPQFPLNPPSGPYINPHIMPITNSGGQHPEGGIHARNLPSADWQYWSRPFASWNSTNKTAKIYLSFIRKLLDI